MPNYLGLDCGGSTSRAIVADESGAILFRGQGGPANLASTTPDWLIQSVAKSLSGCPNIDVACGCFAGLLTPEDASRAKALISDLLSGAETLVYPDYAAAHAAADDADVTVIAGTGSVICSMAHGALRKSGGRGYLLGDVGSTYRYGRCALTHFLDCKNPSAAMLSAVQDTFGGVEEAVVVAAVYRNPTPVKAIAGLAEAFAADAASGAAYASRFLEEESGRFAELLAGHVGRWLPEKVALACSLAGGLWKVSGVFREAFSGAMAKRLPGCEVSLSLLKRPPVEGALRLAMRTHHEH